jgi:hypothetical protein
MSAVNHVNRVNDVNDVNDVKTPTSAACGGVSAVPPPSATFRCSSAFGGGWGWTPPAAAGFSDVIDVIDAVDAVDAVDVIDVIDVIDGGRG